MSFLAFYSALNLITIFLLVFFAVLVLTLRRGSPSGRGMLAALLIALAFSYLDGAVLTFEAYFTQRFTHAFYVGMSFDFIVGPLLWLYVRSRTQPGRVLRAADALHAIPFLLHTGLLSARFHLHSVEYKRALLDAGSVLSETEILWSIVLVHVHFAAYAVLALRPALSYRARLREHYASDRAAGWSWLATIVVGFLMIWSLRFLNGLLWMRVPDWMHANDVEVRPIILLGMLAFVCMLFVQALGRPEVLYFEEKVKYRTALLPRLEQQQHAALLRQYMEERRPYLNSALDLRMLAEGIGLPPHQLSQVLNVSLEQNFFDFVNGYRVRECQRLLGDPVQAHKNVSEIMFEVGFNSKSVFNTAFKRLTGMTPTQYRKQGRAVSFDPDRRRRSAA